MSSALSIAGVSALLRDLLINKLIDQEINGQLGHEVTVTALPPDRVSTGETEPSQLNLFLTRVTPNLGWRNEGLPSRDARSQRLSRAPLALDLHYLISAYGAAPLHAEILLGYAMQLLHENAVISRKAVRAALHPGLEAEPGLPPELRALATSGLENQVEVLKITPEFLDSEELSKFWTASQARFRLSVAYLVSVVLIEADEPTRSPLPVLSRNVRVFPDLIPLPTLDAVVPAEEQPVVTVEQPVTLKGHHLDGAAPKVRLTNDRFEIDSIKPLPDGDDRERTFSIEAGDVGDFPVGVYGVRIEVQPAGEPRPLETNQLAMTLAPEITGLPKTVSLAGGAADFTLDVRPRLRAGQRATLLLGAREFKPQAFTSDVDQLSFFIPEAPVGDHLARLRVDGIESPIVDRTKPVPVFLDRRIKVQ